MLNRKVRYFVAGYRHAEVVVGSWDRDANHLSSKSFPIFRLVICLSIKTWYVFDSFGIAKFPVIVAP